MTNSPVLVAGAGPGGLSVALTLLLMYRAALERLGRASSRTGLRVTGYRNQPDGSGVTALLESRSGERSEVHGSLLIAADGLLNLLDDRCGGVFDNIDDVIPRAERDEFMLRYKTAAGFAAEKLNAASSTIPAGARVR